MVKKTLLPPGNSFPKWEACPCCLSGPNPDFERVVCQKPQCFFLIFGVNDPPSAPIICLDYPNHLQCPRVTSIPKLALLFPSDTSCRHTWKQGTTQSPKQNAGGLLETGASYSRAENNPLENHSLLFYQLILPDLAVLRQLLSYLWLVFFSSSTVAAGTSLHFPCLLSGHHLATGQPGSRGMLK